MNKIDSGENRRGRFVSIQCGSVGEALKGNCKPYVMSTEVTTEQEQRHNTDEYTQK